MKIKKGSLVIIGKAKHINGLGLVLERESKKDLSTTPEPMKSMTNFVIINIDKKKTWWSTTREDELTFILQTDPEKVKTVAQALKLYYRKIIEKLMELRPGYTKEDEYRPKH